MCAPKKEEQSGEGGSHGRPRRNLTVSSSSAQANVRAQLHFLLTPLPSLPCSLTLCASTVSYHTGSGAGRTGEGRGRSGWSRLGECMAYTQPGLLPAALRASGALGLEDDPVRMHTQAGCCWDPSGLLCCC